MGALGTRRLHAQSSPPRPAVALTQLPRFFVATLPADFNEDGHPDLIGGAASAGGFPGTLDLVIALGHGDGTFAAARSLDVAAKPLAVGDFNGDGHADVVIDGLAILPGRGDGTFRAVSAIDASGASSDVDVIAPRAVAADFNGDGKLDFAIVDGANVYVYPGRGDFTFDPRAALPVSDGALSIIVADFNHDGLPDIAASTTSQRVDLFLNHGGLVFSVTSAPIAAVLWDIAAGDLNKDGKPDLIVASTTSLSQFGEGRYYVLLGNGDGTFQAAVSHSTGANGALTLAVRDFNHDGSLDVAIGNRSVRPTDTECSGLTYWDSVTIVPGLGTGGFGTPATFRLGTTWSCTATRTTRWRQPT